MMEILNSWKEIANYLGRGVRTVQRWERDLGLPVHRPKGKDRSAVLAFPAELEAWLHNTPVRSQVRLDDALYLSGAEKRPDTLLASQPLPPSLLHAPTGSDFSIRDVRLSCARVQETRRKVLETARRQHDLAAILKESLQKLTSTQRSRGVAA